MLNYRVVDNYLGGSCNIYKMIFKEVDQRDQLDDCILRVALSGKCPRLTKEDYISDYEYFLGQPENKLAITNNNYICLEYYTTLGIRQQEINKLMQITSMQLNKKVSIKSVWEESVEFYIK